MKIKHVFTSKRAPHKTNNNNSKESYNFFTFISAILHKIFIKLNDNNSLCKPIDSFL